MFYFWIFLFSFSAMVVLLAVWRFRIDLFWRLSAKNLMAYQSKKNLPFFASSYNLRLIICFLLRHSFHKDVRRALAALIKGRIQKAVLICTHSNLNFFADILWAYVNPKKAISLLGKQNSPEAKIESAALLFENGDEAKARDLLDCCVQDKSLPSYYLAKKNFYLAQFYLKEANLESASACAAQAALLFKKCSAVLEEAYAYLLQGTIFRISAVEDVAHFMFCQAKDLFFAVKHKSGEADALANLGMLWTMRENFDMAQKYFMQSWKVNHHIRRNSAAAYVLTQWALMFLLCHKHKKALALLKKALAIHMEYHDIKGQAFVFEVEAYVLLSLQNWKEAATAAQKASELYDAYGLDMSSRAESIYLKACAEFNLGCLDRAEKSLRQCILLSEENASCFHVANAYNLLGLIFLAQNQLARAKSIFLKSASIEQKNERFSGAATDYVNIGFIESRLGNQAQAIKTFQTALKYAEAFDESELSDLIKNEIKKLENNLK